MLTYCVHAAHPLPRRQFLFQQHHATEPVSSAVRGLRLDARCRAPRADEQRGAPGQADGSTETMHGQLRERVRLLAGRTAAPTAAVIDSQSVRAAEEVARSSRGYDAGKKVAGRKRHIAVDTIGLLRRWAVERTLAWITRHRRTVRDYERLPAHHETYIYWSMIMVMTRRLARKAASTATPDQSHAA